jgi:hypothetical protein
MTSCFICRLFGKNALATCSTYIDHTINIVEKKIKSEIIKTYLFGWIKVVEDKMFNEHSHTENNGHKPVCDKCKYVESIATYPDKKPSVVKRDHSTMREELVQHLSDEQLMTLEDQINSLKSIREWEIKHKELHN